MARNFIFVGLIRRKWNKAAIFYYTFLVYYALFLALLSAYMLESTPPYRQHRYLSVRKTYLQL